MPLNKEGFPKCQIFDIPTPEGIVSCVVRMIESSNIKWIGWPEKGGQPLMFVEFADGARYVYIGVKRQKAVAAAYAESSGVYLNKEIKPNYEVFKLR
jgi:hypothetical protein